MIQLLKCHKMFINFSKLLLEQDKVSNCMVKPTKRYHHLVVSAFFLLFGWLS